MLDERGDEVAHGRAVESVIFLVNDLFDGVGGEFRVIFYEIVGYFRHR